jgi:thiol-disulfide isomerase/thioredoxin
MIGAAALVLAVAAAREERTVGSAAQVRAPEFPAGKEWLNTEAPLRLADLRGKVVLLDFWTYCCINCMHVLPELKRLERKWARELVVIGVHSAKFIDEGERENIRQAILRYDIEHPVVVDTDMGLWSMYGVRAWPTLVLIDPTGRVIRHTAGEITFDSFDPVIAAAVERAEADRTLDRRLLRHRLEREHEPLTLLRFPGKVLADERGQRLVIADSSHHRYLVTSLDGEVREVIGDGQPGFVDGSFASARFRRPQGVALVGDRLYLADTENHALRVADLSTRTVSTLVGHGRKPARYNQAGQGKGVALHSPWDVVEHGGLLYVANAGSHQIWTVDPRTAEARPYAGSGREDLVDGPAFVPALGALGADPSRGAALAQPSALAVHGDRLYFADSETSALRWVGLGPEPRVATLIGQGLFQFGDVDGERQAARLQHCLGVAWHDGALYVADTYNSKIKRYDPATGRLTTFAGDGQPGADDGPLARASFDEPGGICAAGGKLYVADSNNHAIRVIDPARGTVSTLALRGVERATPPLRTDTGVFRGRTLTVPPATLAPGEATLEIILKPLQGYHLNPGAPLVVRLNGEAQRIAAPALVNRVPLRLGDAATRLRLEIDAYYCTETGAGACVLDSVRADLDVAVSPAGARKLALTVAQAR